MFFNRLGLVLALIMFYWIGRKHHLKLSQIFALFVVVPMAYSLLFAIRYVDDVIIGDPDLKAGAKLIIVLIPLAMLFGPRIRISALESSDIIVPIFISARATFVIGCIFGGCCHGYPWAKGIYSCVTGYRCIPVPLLDCLFGYTLVIVLLVWAHGYDYRTEGKVAAIGTILYGISFYCSDLLTDNHKLIGASSFDGIYAFIIVIMGLCILHLSIEKRAESAILFRTT